MSGGGSKPRGGKIGTSIRSMTVSAEGIANAEKELAALANKLNDVRQRMMDSARRYQASEKTVAALEMELAKSQKEVMLSSKSEKVLFLDLLVLGIDIFHSLHLQVDSLKSQHNYIEKQLASLETASNPQEDELDRLNELKNIISAEEREIDRLTNGSKELKEKVGLEVGTSSFNSFTSRELPDRSCISFSFLERRLNVEIYVYICI